MKAVQTGHDLERWAPSWEGLINRHPRPYIFYSPGFIKAWQEELAPSAPLTLLAVHRGEEALAIAPLIDQGREMRLAGDPQVFDYMDLIIDPAAEEEALVQLLNTLVSLPWEQFILWGLHEASYTRQALPQLAPKMGLLCHEEVEAVCPQVTLPPSWEEYLAALPRKDRHELERKLRRLLRLGEPELEVHITPQERAQAMDDFLRLHRISRAEKAQFMTEQMERFFRRIALLAPARLYFLRLQGQRVASLLCFMAKDTLQLYNSGFDPDYSHLAVGLLSKALLVKEAIAQGLRYVDFLRGAEPYKYSLGARDVKVYRLTLTKARTDV